MLLQKIKLLTKFIVRQFIWRIFKPVRAKQFKAVIVRRTGLNSNTGHATAQMLKGRLWYITGMINTTREKPSCSVKCP